MIWVIAEFMDFKTKYRKLLDCEAVVAQKWTSTDQTNANLLNTNESNPQ